LPSGLYQSPRVSPDGKHIAVSSLVGTESVVWIYDLSGTTSIRRLTFGGNNRFPIWTTDGGHVAFQSDRDGDLAIFWQRADGSTPAERLTRPAAGVSHVPDTWTANGLLFEETKGIDTSLWMLALPDKKVTSVGGLHAALPINATISPDGKWMTYQSGRAGENGIYVQPFPPSGPQYQISKGNAHHPVWSRDGKQIIYIPAQSQPLVVSVITRPSFSVSNTPIELPRKGIENGPASVRNYDVLPDGRLIAVVAAIDTPSDLSGAQQIHVVLNWFDELKQRVPVR
jgi:Tol biopolymer transport system component